MYDNIGGKIKTLAKVLTWIGIIASVICGIGIIASGDELFAFIGVMIALLGSVLSWVSSFLLYGFGELIDKVCYMAQNTHSSGRKSEAQSKNDYERINKIEKLHSQGLITEEEYQQAISK